MARMSIWEAINSTTEPNTGSTAGQGFMEESIWREQPITKSVDELGTIITIVR